MGNINLSSSELLFYSGIAVMAAAFVLSIVCIAAFMVKGRKLKEKLIQEYGEPL